MPRKYQPDLLKGFWHTSIGLMFCLSGFLSIADVKREEEKKHSAVYAGDFFLKNPKAECEHLLGSCLRKAFEVLSGCASSSWRSSLWDNAGLPV